MNLTTILGATCLDPFLRKQMFKDPAETARDYGFNVDDNDLRILRMIFADPKQIDEDFRAVQNRICTHPPCPLPPGFLEVLAAASLDKVLVDELFADPIGAINKHGFTLSYYERYVLTSIVCEDRMHLKEPLETLARKISQLTGKAPWVKAA